MGLHNEASGNYLKLAASAATVDGDERCDAVFLSHGIEDQWRYVVRRSIYESRDSSTDDVELFELSERGHLAAIKLGINMAGAVSAGAYTAGVLDFLIQALDEWYAAKAAGENVPGHDISIEVIIGASAGGMCAAIAGTQVQEELRPHHGYDSSGYQQSVL